MEKRKIQSKTLWVNGLAFIASVATMAGLDLGLTEEVQASLVVAILTLVNFGLRLATSAKLVK